MPQQSHLVSIIIVTFNSEDYILSCLSAISKSTYRQFEIIVIDNNSTDKTIYLISHSFPKVRIINSNKNLGYAGGNNLGIKYAKGKYIAIINPDTQVSPSWLEPLIKGLTIKNVVISQPKILLLNKTNLINCTGKTTQFLGFEWLTDYKKRDKDIQNKFIDSFSGSIFLTTKSFFIKSGEFDESFFMYYEDGDLSWRVRLGGKLIVLIPTSIAYHDYKYIPNENYQRARQKFYYLERNRLIMIIKNYSTRTLILLLPAIIFMELGMLFYFVSKGWFSDKIKEYLWIIKNLNKIAAKRSFTQKMRKISDKQFTKNFEGKIDYEELNNLFLNHLVNPLLSIYWKITKNFI